MKRLFLAGIVAAVMALAPASQALGSSHNPTGEFAPFAECPLNNEAIVACIFSESSGGGFTVGKKEVPLVNPVVLQGGLEPAAEGTQFQGAENGETLSKTPQPVPGGLLGIVAPSWWPSWLQKWFNDQINEGLTGVNATVEIAGPATNIEISTLNLLIEQGTALSLPVKIKLSNAILGSNCYIGSNSSPIVIDFTSGTTEPPPPNEPISGSSGELSVGGEGKIITLSGGSLVNNSFGAPGAKGCGGIFSFFIDPLVNSILGAPSPAGTNTAILEGKLQSAEAAAVKASE